MQTLKFFADRGHRRAATLVGLVGLCATLDAQAFQDWHWWGHNNLQITGSPATSDVAGTPYRFTPITVAPRNTSLTYSISSKPAWASFSARTGQLTGTPATTNAGKYANIVITVSDGAATASLAPFSITVTSPVAASKPPTISGTPSTAVNVGAAYAFTPSSTDPSGKALTFSVKNAPSWTAFNTATGGNLRDTERRLCGHVREHRDFRHRRHEQRIADTVLHRREPVLQRYRHRQLDAPDG